MASVAPRTSADQAGDLLQKLSLDSQSKTMEVPEQAKKPSANQFGSVDTGNSAIGQMPSDRSVTPLLPDPTVCYVPNAYPSQAFYYGGFDGTGNEWDEYTRYVNGDGVEMTAGVYGDNGSLMYPHGYGFAPYGPYSPAASPVPAMGNDGLLYGPQQYQYPQYFQPLTPNSGPYTPTLAAVPQADVSASVAADQKPIQVEAPNANSNGLGSGGVMKGNNGAATLKPTYQSSTLASSGTNGKGGLAGRIQSGYQDPRYGFDGLRVPWLDGPLYSDGQSRPATSSTVTPPMSNGTGIAATRNSNYRPNSHFMGLHHPRPMAGVGTTQGFINRMYPNKIYGQHGNAVRSGLGYVSNGYESRANGRAWLAVDNKFKNRGRTGSYYGYGNENMDGLNELNRGPRARVTKNQKGSAPSVLVVKGQNIPISDPKDDEKDKTTAVPDRDQFNRADFREAYTDAKFLIIKSYSEDDIHKSIKYSVWASTPNGNKKLDAAYQEAQDKASGCPVFLFFSVNTSGQFVGLAEMIGPVDFNKTLEYWQQDKWNGCFPVKWHIVKDVPNSLLKHITLENNENKPVTNSRDTQEVKFDPGLQMIKIFKEHSSRTCILDDFGFYEARQKTIQEKKAKHQQFQKQVWEGKPTDNKKEGADAEPKAQNTVEALKDLTKESNPSEQVKENLKLSEVSAAKAGDLPKGAKPVVSEKRTVANGVANGY